MPGKDRIFSSCPRSVFRCGYHVFFSKILFVMLWILIHLSWLEFQTQYRGYDPSSSRGCSDIDDDVGHVCVVGDVYHVDEVDGSRNRLCR